MVNDTIADYLTRVRNAQLRKQEFVTIPSTKLLVAISEILKKYSALNLKADIINGIKHSHSINYRRDMDLTFDHLGGYYGVNSLESAALGIVNLVKLDENNKKEFCKIAGTDTTPWDLIETKEDISERIEYYYQNRDKLEERKKEVKEWMHTYWTPKKHLDRIKRYFNELTRNNI